MDTGQVMNIWRTLIAFLMATLATFVSGSVFYTQQVVSEQISIGADYTLGQQAAALMMNLKGLAPAYGGVMMLALLIGFLIAARLKRVLTPLAPVAYPIAGATAVVAAIWLIDNTAGRGGVGAIGGARDAVGMGLQSFAGLVGGVVFAALRGRGA